MMIWPDYLDFLNDPGLAALALIITVVFLGQGLAWALADWRLPWRE